MENKNLSDAERLKQQNLFKLKTRRIWLLLFIKRSFSIPRTFESCAFAAEVIFSSSLYEESLF